jgi:hypothetical protein
MSWSFSVSWSWLLLGAALWGLSGWLGLRQWQRLGRQPRVARLEILRVVIVGLVVATLFRPEIVVLDRREDQPVVVVLSDRSESMQTRDVVRSNTVATRAEWIDQEETRASWKRLEPQAQVIAETIALPSAPAAEATHWAKPAGTDLGSPIDGALQQHRNLKAILLLTDGNWNSGPSPVISATRARQRGVPLFTLAVGSEQPIPDLGLENVSPPSYGLLGEQISLPFKIVNHLPRLVTTTVTLRDGVRAEGQKQLTIPAGGEVQEVIVYAPRSVGERRLVLSLPVEPEETVTNNNQQSFALAVRVETLKVLVIDSQPRWEYRYLRNALARDPGVEVHCVLFHPDLAPGAGRDYLPAFPNTQEALSRYDVVFLGDVGFDGRELTPKDAELLRGLVERQSSGLVFVPGRRGRHLTWPESALGELLPVTLDRAKPEGIPLQNESTLVLTTSGKRHWLTRFDSLEDRNEEIWKQLPGFYWSAAVEKSRPGSEVLAVHGSLRNQWGRLPLLAIRPAGTGKVLFLGTDSAWRWRRGVEDLYHYRFWSQVVRWMAHQRHLADDQGIRLSYTPETPQAGDVLHLQATVLDASGQPAQQGPVIGRLTTPRGRSERLEFTPTEGGWGVFQSTYPTREAGPHELEIASEPNQRRMKTTLAVTSPVRERIGEPANYRVLREMAAVSGGAFGTTDDLQALVQRISVLPEPRPAEVRVQLWCHPVWGAFLLFLWAAYWTGRKWAGMI